MIYHLFNGSVPLNFNHDRSSHYIDTMESSNTQAITLLNNRTGIERRSGKDRRLHYAEKRKISRIKLKRGVYVLLKRQK